MMTLARFSKAIPLLRVQELEAASVLLPLTVVVMVRAYSAPAYAARTRSHRVSWFGLL
jgi:hypothetical protein